MKKLIPFLLLALVTSATAAQEMKPGFNREYYLAKSKNQRTVGMVLSLSGVAIVTVGSLVWLEDFEAGLDFSQPDAGVTSVNEGDIMIVIGGAVFLSSIPFFIAAGKNRKKALSLSAGMQEIPVPQPVGIGSKSVPSLTVKIPLGNR